MDAILGVQCLVCSSEHPLEPRTTVCPRCGGNLDVVYNNRAIKKYVTRQQLKRNKEHSIWRYAPLLPLEDLEHLPPLQIGWTPLIPAVRLGQKLGLPHLYLKDEGRNPSGSLKDRASAVVLMGALQQKIMTVVGASTGNAGSSMACLAASVGLECVIFLPERAPLAKMAQLLAFGARVIPVAGSYDQAYDLSLKVSMRFGWFSRSTGENPLTREGKKTCAFEIWEQLQLEVPDWVFVPVGDGNIISGLHKGFCQLRALGLIERVPRLCAVQSTRSAAVARTVARLGTERITPPPEIHIAPVQSTTRADSIAVDLPRDGVAAVRAIQESGGFALQVTDEAILAAIPTIARWSGVFAEPAGAAAVAALEPALQAGLICPEDRIVCVITGNGLKDVPAVLEVINAPSPIEPSLPAVLTALGLPGDTWHGY